MVTTRSADKQANTNGRTEELTLRAKPEDDSPSVRVSSAETSTPSSTRKKTKIIVNVPPPRKRARLSVDGSEDVEGIDSNLSSGEPSTVEQQEQSTVTEVPDSDDSDIETHSNSIVQQNISTPLTQQSTKRKRKITGTQQITIDSTTVAVAGKHKRFGSEEPATDEASVMATEGGEREAAGSVLSDDTDDAPEVATTKSATTAGTSGKRRTTRGKKTARKVEQPEPDAGIAKQGGIDSSQSVEDQEKTPKATPLPALKLNTEQDAHTSLAIGSDDSQDSAFVTARTTRHHDIFSTPLGGTPQLTSPTRDQPEHVPYLTIPSRRPGVTPFNNLTQDLSTIHLTETKPSRTALASANNVSLPNKTTNSLEHYRRQMLRNRANKAAGTTRERRFRLQDEWAGKRRKFVLGY